MIQSSNRDAFTSASHVLIASIACIKVSFTRSHHKADHRQGANKHPTSSRREQSTRKHGQPGFPPQERPHQVGRFASLFPKLARCIADGSSYRLHESEEFSDCKLICGPYHFNLHRVILASQSDYFRAAFKQGTFKVMLLSTDVHRIMTDWSRRETLASSSSKQPRVTTRPLPRATRSTTSRRLSS